MTQRLPGHASESDAKDPRLYRQLPESQHRKGETRSCQVALDIPSGFKFLNKDQSIFVLTKLWGNPESATKGVIGKIDCDQLLKSIQEDETKENVERVKAGYPTIHMVGWAEKPYYDNQKKVLHWAKERPRRDRKIPRPALEVDRLVLRRHRRLVQETARKKETGCSGDPTLPAADSRTSSRSRARNLGRSPGRRRPQ